MKVGITLLAPVLLTLFSVPAGADPQVRATAVGDTRSQVGLVVLEGAGELGNGKAEVLAWTGSADERREAQVLVIAVHGEGLKGRARGKLGRFILSPGGLRPVHLDGAWGSLRLPARITTEAFAGVPVQAGLDGRSFDWLIGSRVSRSIGDYGSVGIGYLHRRDYGRLADEEVAVDAGAQLGERVTGAARASFDITDNGLSEARLIAGYRLSKAWRFEGVAAHLSPSRILPATSLFSVLGDVPSRRLGGGAFWRAAPRLDLHLHAAARFIDGEIHESLASRATLRLDARGAGAIVGGLRRDSTLDGAWSGAHVALRLPLLDPIHLGVEAELARPDQAQGRGEVWPWGLVALGYQPSRVWNVAAALEASASPSYRHRLDALVTLSRSLEVSP